MDGTEPITEIYRKSKNFTNAYYLHVLSTRDLVVRDNRPNPNPISYSISHFKRSRWRERGYLLVDPGSSQEYRISVVFSCITCKWVQLFIKLSLSLFSEQWDKAILRPTGTLSTWRTPRSASRYLLFRNGTFSWRSNATATTQHLWFTCTIHTEQLLIIHQSGGIGHLEYAESNNVTLNIWEIPRRPRI